MLGRPETFRALAIIVLIVVAIAALAAMNHRPSARAMADTPAVATIPDDLPVKNLPAELRHCRTLGPRDAGEAHCRAVWEENRRRFFGRPARPLPPPSPPGTAAPANPSAAKPVSGGAYG